MPMPVYLDCNATTPMEPRVRDKMLRYFEEEFGNAGSRTHEYGNRAKQAVQRARDQVASVVDAKRDEVVFTSGATESNNIALQGLAHHGEETGHKHIVTTAIEHKAVLEPLAELERRGFEVTRVPCDRGGWVEAEHVLDAVRSDTLLVSVMHVNNETGVVQPIEDIADGLGDHPAYFHTDGAQGFGKQLEPLKKQRLDLISVSGHKVFGPKGVGGLVARRRGFKRPPIRPLMFGGGQERGLRAGTTPVPLVVGLGVAAELAERDASDRAARCAALREKLLQAIEPLDPVLHGDQSRTLPHVVNLAFPGIDSEAVMVALKDWLALSNGSACTSQKYEPSHVLEAMGIDDQGIQGALRFSWCHLTPEPDWQSIVQTLQRLRC